MNGIRKALVIGGASAALVGASLFGTTAAMAATHSPASSDYGNGAVNPGGGDHSYPVQLEAPSVHPGETVDVPAPKAPNGSPVTVDSQEGLQPENGKVTYHGTGYYHWSFQSEDNSYTGVVLVRVVR